MPTFLALQCYRCNMMQVKHDKKSSNKWNCSVCNEKQSVRKIFATSTAAKDIRMFVQNYNMSRNISQDRVLAELAENAELGDNLGCDDVPVFQMSDGFSQPHVSKESKWNEFLPLENNGLFGETLEATSDDGAHCVTIFPERVGRKAKGGRGARAVVEDVVDKHHRFQSPFCGASLTSKRKGEFSYKSIKSCLDGGADKENDLPSIWARTVPTCLLPEAQSMYHKELLSLPARAAAHLSVQRSGGGRKLMHATIGSTRADDALGISGGMSNKPISNWANFMDAEDDAKGQRSCIFSDEEGKQVSKWAKYMDFDEVKPKAPVLQGSGMASKWANCLDASVAEASLKGRQTQESSSWSIWSLKAAATNLGCLESLVKTELDELLPIPLVSEEVDEVHSPLL